MSGAERCYNTARHLTTATLIRRMIMAAAECIHPIHSDSGPSTPEMPSSSAASKEFRTLTISEGQPHVRGAAYRNVRGASAISVSPHPRPLDAGSRL